MNSPLRLAVLTLFLLCFHGGAAGQNPDKNQLPGLNSITARDLRAHLNFLASPELEGRETGYRGQKVAARYIASVFEKLGLRPAGDNGTYFQHFDVELTRINPASHLVLEGPGSRKVFPFGKDFLGFTIADTLVRGPVVFAGYLDSPTDSLTEASLHGKIALVIGSSRTRTADTLQRPRGRMPLRPSRGSLATLVIVDEERFGSLEQQYERMSGFLAKGRMRLMEPEVPARPAGPLAYGISADLAAELFRRAGFDMRAFSDSAAADSFRPLPLKNTTVALDLKADRE
ncbi:MAG: hypothetical protein WD295_02060, partial [Bacteroidota bacterium]